MGILQHFFFPRKIKTQDELHKAIDGCVSKLERLRLHFLNACIDMLGLPELIERRYVFVGSKADFALRGLQFRLVANHVGTNEYVSRELFEKLIDEFPVRMVAGKARTPKETRDDVERLCSYSREYLRCGTDVDKTLATLASHLAFFLVAPSGDSTDLAHSANLTARILPYGMFLSLNTLLVVEELFGSERSRSKLLHKRSEVSKELGDFYGLQIFS